MVQFVDSRIQQRAGDKLRERMRNTKSCYVESAFNRAFKMAYDACELGILNSVTFTLKPEEEPFIDAIQKRFLDEGIQFEYDVNSPVSGRRACKITW